MNHSNDTHGPPPLLRWAFWGFAAVAAFFLITEHAAHLFGVLPFLLILACPLMHIFGHGGHGHGGHRNDTREDDARPADERDRDSHRGHQH